MRIALFPGSFDPMTKGHENIIARALSLFDKIIVAIGKNSSKNSFFTLEQRLEMIRMVFPNENKIEITSYDGLTIDFCKKNKINYMLRGLRTAADFEYERCIAQMNKAMMPGIDTFFLLTTPELTAINSSVVRDILKGHGDFSPFVPKRIVSYINEINKQN